jgi:hypothetical protein
MKPVVYLIGAALLMTGTVWAGPHKLRVSDPALAESLVLQGGRLVADYGSFQIIETDQPSSAGTEDGRSQPADEMNLIQLNSVTLDTTRPQAQALRQPTGTFAGKRLHLVHFVGPIKPEWSAALERTGVQIVSYLPENAYLVYGDATAIARLQMSRESSIQWNGPFLDAYKIHPRARAANVNGRVRAVGTDTFTIQLVADTNANPVTLQLIDQWKLRPVLREVDIPGFRNVTVALPAERLADIAARPEVVSILPFFEPRKMDERQDQIIAGAISGGQPTGPGYLAWLASKGFTQAQFDASHLVVDVSDSGIDNGTTKPGHFGLYSSGNPLLKSRVAYNRVEGMKNPGSSLKGCDGHGTLNAHVISGFDDFDAAFPFSDTGGFTYGLGVCPFVQVGSSVIFDPDFFTYPSYSKLQTDAYKAGARISNNSWGAPGSDGVYDIDAELYDILVRSVTEFKAGSPMVIVFSAGNEGPVTETVSSPGTAKNVITVGAAENVRSLSDANGGVDSAGDSGCTTSTTTDNDSSADNANDMTDFSSRGPCADGRKKPEIVAPGTHITGGVAQGFAPTTNGFGQAILCFNASGVCGSYGNNNTPLNSNGFFPLGQQFYTVSTGTSHSAPAICGACALLRQYFINASLTAPSPAMTKAFLMNSARYLTGAYANDTLWSTSQGMGEVDLDTAFDGVPRVVRDQLSTDKVSAAGQKRTFTGTVSDPSKPFRVTLAWTDYPSTPIAAKALVNDLDLTVTVGGSTYLGNVFSGPQSVTGGVADSLNNVESVFLPAGVSGSFTVTVTAAKVTADALVFGGLVREQDFALVVYNAESTTLPYAPMAASYSGLFYESNGVQVLSSGAVNLKTTAAGAFSGTLQMGSSRYVCSGLFNSNGVASALITRKNTNSLNLTLRMDTTDNNLISGTVDGGTWMADLEADRVPFDAKNNPCLLAGKYTFILPGAGDGSPLRPQGDCYGTVSVSTAGLIKLTGALADGTKLSQSASVLAHGRWPLYVPLYSGAGEILSWLTFSNSAQDDFSGPVSWIKPAISSAKYFPAGFDLETNAIGSIYHAPASTTIPILAMTNDFVLLTDGNLGNNLTNSVTIGPKSQVFDQTLVNKLKLTVSTSLGSFKGTFQDPVTLKPVSFSGVLLQKQNYGSGYFLGTNQSGRVYFGP